MRIRRILSLGAVAVVLFFGRAGRLAGQAPEKDAKAAEAKATSEVALPKEESSITEHTVRIGGQIIPYKATAGTILLKDEKGEANAGIFYMAYTRNDVKDVSQRPLAFLYNGGPGTFSIWLHMWSLRPPRAGATRAGATQPPPCRQVPHPNTPPDEAAVP